MIWILLLIFIAVIYVVVTRSPASSREGFQELQRKKYQRLLDAEDLGSAAGPSLRDLLIEKDPVFFKDQLDIYNSTRAIYDKIIKTVAGVLAAEDMAAASQKTAIEAYIEPAIQSITDRAGEAPRFCSAKQLDALLDAPATSADSQPNLDDIHKCFPKTPGKYLLLLSYASRILKEQFDNGGAALGGSYTEIGLEEPPIYNSGSAVEAATKKKKDASIEPYVSKYALQAPPRTIIDGFTGSSASAATAAASASPRPSSFDNQLASWKSAFDNESVNRIRMYIRYCNKIYQKLDTIKGDAESGSLLKKMDIGAATETAKGLLGLAGDNMNIPL